MNPPACSHSWLPSLPGTVRCEHCHAVRASSLALASNRSEMPSLATLAARLAPDPSPSLTDAAEATLLFYSASPWTEEKRRRWHELTGTEEATTRNLCDTCRKALQQEGGAR